MVGNLLTKNAVIQVRNKTSDSERNIVNQEIVKNKELSDKKHARASFYLKSSLMAVILIIQQVSDYFRLDGVCSISSTRLFEGQSVEKHLLGNALRI